MTGIGHRLTTFMLLGSATNSVLAGFFGMLGSAFPDTLEYLLWGANRNRHHRKISHWFVPWAAAFFFCFFRGGFTLPHWGTLLSLSADPKPVWACAAFWFLGTLVHVFEDACCGKVPLWVPWKKTFGVHVFKMSPHRGEMSRGEFVFVGFITLGALSAWLLRLKA